MVKKKKVIKEYDLYDDQIEHKPIHRLIKKHIKSGWFKIFWHNLFSTTKLHKCGHCNCLQILPEDKGYVRKCKGCQAYLYVDVPWI